jgi:toxin ParE1/3/4
MKLRLTPRAIADLQAIADFVTVHNPRAALRVRSAILGAFRTLLMFPRAGRRQDIEGVRKFTTRRYGYVIYYSLSEDRSTLTVLTVQHGARQRPTTDR